MFYGVATNGGTLAYQKQAPTREAADKLLDGRLNAPFRADANDTLYQWDSSRDYNPSPRLERIEAALLAINAADDERNPPETGIMERELKRVKNGKLYLIPASENTAGHGTTAQAQVLRRAAAPAAADGAQARDVAAAAVRVRTRSTAAPSAAPWRARR